MCINNHIWKVFFFYIVFCNGSNHDLVSASSGFFFGGTSTLTGYYSSYQAFGHSIPPAYMSWQLRGQLSVFHIPLSFSSLLTTQQDSRSQSINHITVQLDTRALSRHLNSIGRLGFLRILETFEVGRTRPQYTSLVMRGVPVDGVNVSLRAGIFHTAFVYGNSRRPVERGVYLEQRYRQQIIYGRLGAGNENKTFIALSALHAKDDNKSMQPTGKYYHWPADTLVHHLDTLFIEADSASVFRRPGEVLIPAIEAGISLFKQKLSVRSELAGMANTSNTAAEPIDTGRIPKWINHIHPVRLSTSFSYAYNVIAELRLPTTRLHVAYRHIAPGYYSPGTPFARQDQQQITLRGSRSLLNRRLTIQPHYRKMNNNLLGQHKATTYTTVWGILASWRQANQPWFSVSFSPHLQKMDHDTHPTKNMAHVVTFTSGKNYVLREQIDAVTSFSWSHQRTKTSQTDIEKSFIGNNFALQQSLRMHASLQMVANGGLYFLEGDDLSLTSYQLMIRGNYHITQLWLISAGVRHYCQGGNRKRWSARFETAYDFGRYGKLQLLAEPTYYRDVLNPEKEYDQYVFRLQFINKW